MSDIYGGRGIEIVSGNGALIRDSSGREHIDFLCGNGSALFGHCHPVLTEAAAKAAYSPWTNSPGLVNAARDNFRKALAALVPDGKVFLCNSGTEAIEAALKLAVALRPGRKKIVALRRAFHGRTMGALALTFNPQYRKAWADILMPVTHVAADDISSAVDENTAVVFAEPIQGEGGVHPLSAAQGQAITRACRESGAILAVDEIQSGMGRCGSLLASPQTGLEPDIITLSKGLAGGLPAGAVIWKGALGDFPSKGHGSTNGGNPFVSSVGLAAWGLLQSERYPERAAKNGAFFASLLGELAQKSPLIHEVRHMGLLFGAELTVKADPVVRELQERGVLALNAGPKVVRFLPPFTANEEHFSRVAETFGAVLDSCEKLA